MKLIRLTCLLTVLVLTAAPAVADRVILRNGRELTGKILSETAREIVIDVGDGMKMTVRKAVVKSIERTADEPEPTPEPVPEPEPDPVPPPKIVAKKSPGGRGVPGFFERTPVVAWRATFGRYPELVAAKVTRFRAYELVERAPLATAATDERVKRAIRLHGHGGSISLWKFKYLGVRELEYGDKVKFIGEITSPAGSEPSLITLEQGPDPTVRRIVVILVRKEFGTERYATTTTFTNRDFRTTMLKELEHKALPVRSYEPDYSRLGTSWLPPAKTKILSDLTSAFGNSPRTRIERFRFRVEWFRTPPAKRPGLDPVLLQQNAVRPLAREGRKAATAGFVAKMWGNEEIASKRLEREIAAVREGLAAVGVIPGREYYIERDLIGRFGEKGVTIETVRTHLPKSLLDELLQP